MALLQKTLVSGSIWIGSGSGTAWEGYIDSHNLPFAIYQNNDPLLYYNINQNSSGGSLVIPTTTSINSNIYSSGFQGEGFKIFANPKTVDNVPKLFWTGQFDDLWVRGSMHVKQFVIDQIRATNGSLYISDAASAISASFVGTDNKGTMSLYFQTGSTMPFVQNDIIRSKRWIPDGLNGIAHQWDFLAGVTQIGSTTSNDITYNTVSFTTSRTGYNYTNYYYGSGDPDSTVADFASTISVLSSQWVRVGNLSAATGRSGSIYLTSNDSGGPFMDVVSGVNTIIDALGGTSATSSAGDVPSTTSVSQSKLKLRLGNLQGIYDQAFGGQLSGYGMWADNAYLRGWIVANQGGNIAGWKIEPNTLSNLSMKLVANTNTSYIGLGTDEYSQPGIWIGTSSAGSQFSVGTDENYIRWDGSGFTVSTPNFRIQTGSVSMSGIVSATSGLIGGWNIGDTSLYSPGITLSSGTIKSIGLNATTYGGTGIYMGTSSAGVSFSVVGSNGSIRFATNSLAISTSNFSAIDGNITARNAVISGSISSSAGQIGGWSIEDQWLQNSSSNALIRLSTTSSYWDLINGQGVFNYDTGLHPQMYTLFTCSYDGFNTQANQWGTTSIATGSFIQQEGGKPSQVYIQYTASYGNNRELLFYINTNSSAQIIVPPKQTIFYSLEIRNLEASIMGGLGAPPPVELYSVMYTASGYNKGNKQNSEYFIGMTGENASFRIVSSYTNPSQDQTKVMSLGIYSRVKADTGATYKVAFTMSNVFVNNVKSVTQLSDKGLFLFAGPNKFLKISSDPTVPGSTQQYAVASLDVVNAGKLYIGGEQVRLGESGSIGGGIGGDGTTGYIPMFQDDTTIEDSPLSLIGSSLTSSVPISASVVYGLYGYNSVQDALNGLLYAPFTWSVTSNGTIATGSTTAPSFTLGSNRGTINPIALSVTLSAINPFGSSYTTLLQSQIDPTLRTITYSNADHNWKQFRCYVSSIDQRGENSSQTPSPAYRYVYNYFYWGAHSNKSDLLVNPQWFTASSDIVGWTDKPSGALATNRSKTFTPDTSGYLFIAYPLRFASAVPTLTVGGFGTDWDTTITTKSITNSVGGAQSYVILFTTNAVGTSTCVIGS